MLVGELPFGIVRLGPNTGAEPVRSINCSAFVPCSVSTAKPFVESRAMLLGNALPAPRLKQGGYDDCGAGAPGQGTLNGFGVKFENVGCTARLVVTVGNGGCDPCGAVVAIVTS